MYENIGAKIKTIATIVGIGGACLCGVVGLFATFVSGNAIWLLVGVLVGVLVLISSWPLYGFGELVENSQQQTQLLQKQNQLLKKELDHLTGFEKAEAHSADQ